MKFPKEWALKKIEDIGVLSSSGVDKTINPDESPVRLVNYLDVYKRDFIWDSNLNHCVSATKDKHHKCSIKKGDVFFTPSSELPNDIAHSAVAMEEMPNVVYSYHIYRLRLKEDWDLKYRAYAFKNAFFYKQAEMKAAGSGQRYVIPLSIFKKIEVPVPPLEEQKKIAAVLSDMDALIEAQEALIEKKQNIKSATMELLLTGKKRLPGFTGEWEEKELGDFIRLRNERTGLKGHSFTVELEHLNSRTGHLNGHLEEFHSIKNIFKKDDILFGKLRSYLRKYWLADRPGVCSTEFWVMVPDNTMFNRYLFQLVQTDSFIKMTSSTYGTHMPRSDWNIVKTFKVSLPSKLEQIKIAEILDCLDQEIELLQQENKKLKNQKQAVMHKLLTGEIRLA